MCQKYVSKAQTIKEFLNEKQKKEIICVAFIITFYPHFMYRRQ